MSRSVCLKTDQWFIETPLPGSRRYKLDAFRIDQEIYQGKSAFQHIHVFESKGFGRILALDGIIQFSQSDEFIYHEVIAHIPLFSHPNPRRILVVGGGDGGVMREAAKHPLTEMAQVELDREVVAICRRFLPSVSKGVFSDKRLKLCFEDGKKFIKKYQNYFDLIIVDSTDPVGPGKVLFQIDFYRDLVRALTKNGIAVFQMGALLDFDLLVRPYASKLRQLFKHLACIRLPMPSYSCGCEYSFLMASKQIDVNKLTATVISKRVKQRLGAQAKKLKYYTPELHCASLVMPKLWQLPS